jgi:hypothetical protein
MMFFINTSFLLGPSKMRWVPAKGGSASGGKQKTERSTLWRARAIDSNQSQKLGVKYDDEGR